MSSGHSYRIYPPSTLYCRRDKAENVVHRELGVYFKDLQVTGLGATVMHQPTVGSMVDPRNIMHAIEDIRHPAVRSILQGFDGVVRPGEMLRTSNSST